MDFQLVGFKEVYNGALNAGNKCTRETRASKLGSIVVSHAFKMET